jgi:hypothetical protein
VTVRIATIASDTISPARSSTLLEALLAADTFLNSYTEPATSSGNTQISTPAHTSAYVSLRQHTRSSSGNTQISTPVSVSTRQHTSAYVSIHVLELVDRARNEEWGANTQRCIPVRVSIHQHT